MTTRLEASPEKGSLQLTEEYIRERAYQIFEKRGSEHGHDLDDWLQAEAEIFGEFEFASLEEVQRNKKKKAA